MKKRFFYVIFSIIFTVFFLSSITYSVSYFNHKSLFDSEIVRITQESDFQYSITVEVNTFVKDKIEYDIEVIYEPENLVLGTDKFECQYICRNKIDVKKTFFGQYKVYVVAKYKNKFYREEIEFLLELDQNEYDVIIPSEIKLDALNGIILSGSIDSQNSKSNEFIFEIYPKSSPSQMKTFRKTCKNKCDFEFNIDSEIVIDEYYVNVYSQLGDLRRKFKLVLPYEITPKQKDKFREFFSKNSKEDLREYFFYNNIEDKNIDVNFKFKKNKVEKLKQELNATDLVDIEFNFNDKTVKKIELKNARVNETKIGFENVPLNKVLNDFPDAVNSFAIDPTKTNPEMESYTLTFVASSDQLMKCEEYNFTTQTCFGEYIKILNTIPGQTYTINLTPKDPLFVELPDNSFDVQRSSTTSTATTFGVNINVTTENRTMIIMEHTNADSNPQDWQFTQNMTNNSYIEFTKYASAVSTRVDWEAITSGLFYVQRGLEVLATSTDNAVIRLGTSINRTASFMIVEGRCSSGTNNNNHAGHLVFGEIMNTTHINVERGQSSLCEATISWQVVQMRGAVVQSGRTAFGTTGTSLPDTLNNSITMNQSFLVFGTGASTGTDRGMDTNLIRGAITGASTVTFTRAGDAGTSNRDVVWYVVEHPDLYVQRGSYSGSADTTETITNAVNESRAFRVTSVTNSGGGQSYANGAYSTYITSSTGLYFDKQTGSNTQGLEWEVIEFGGGPEDVDNQVFLTSTTELNLSSETLTCSYTELDSGVTSIFHNWFYNNNTVMVGAYPFEGGTSDSLNDLSNNTNSCSNTGATWSATSGLASTGGYTFDGDGDFLSIADNNDFGMTSNITIMAWTRMLGQSADGDFSRILSKGQSTTTNGAYGMWVSDPDQSSIGCRLIDTSTAYDVTLTDGTENDNAWHHYACSYNGTQIRLFVDGIEADTNDVSISIDQTSDAIQIGNGNSERAFNGTIDEVRIYNRSLSAEQIYQISQNNTNLIVGNETIKEEQWFCSITTFSSSNQGLDYYSNDITIVSDDRPQLANVELTSASASNYTGYDLTCNYDLAGTATNAAVNWFLNSESISLVNLPFEGNSSNALIDFSRTHNATCTNCPTWDNLSGHDGYGGYNFDGTGEYLNVSSFSSAIDNFTISVWINPTTTDCDTSNDCAIITGGTASDVQLMFNSDSDLRFCSDSAFDCVDVPISNIQTDTWQLITAVYNSSHCSLYKNDTFLGSDTCNSIVAPTYLLIGEHTSFTRSFNGSIDDVNIYNRSLSPEQISNIYNGNKNVLHSNETNHSNNLACEITPFDYVQKGETITSNDITVFDPPPVTNITKIQPASDNISVYENAQFDFSFNVSCVTSTDCNNINVTLNYQTPQSIGEAGQLTLSNNANTTITFINTYNQTPVLIPLPTTDTNGDDNGLIPVIHDINSTHAIVSICEDAGATTCSSVVEAENMSYYVLDIHKSNAYSWIDIGYITSAVSDGTADAFTYGKTFSTAPDVFTWAQTDNDGDNSIAPIAWITGIGTSGANIVPCDHPGTGDTCAGGTTEDYAYVAIDFANADITNLNYGSEAIADSTWTPITFGYTYTSPILITGQNEEVGGQDPQYPWARDVISTGADIRYCEQDAAGVCNTHSAETMNWMVVEEGLIQTSNFEAAIVSDTLDDTPMYSPLSNPANTDINGFAWEEISFPVFFTGAIGTSYEFYATVDYGVQDSEHFNTTLLPSSLNGTLISPSGNRTIVIINETFEVQINLTCEGYCGGPINAYPRYDLSTITNVTGATPIYSLNESNQTCNPGIDGNCVITWVINATDGVGNLYDIDVWFNSTVFGENETDDAEILIASGPEVIFNQTILNITGAIANYEAGTGIVKVEALIFNQTNLSLTCDNGNCSFFSTDFVDLQDLNADETIDVAFSCLPSSPGNFTAQFTIESSEDTNPSYLNLTCEAIELELYTVLDTPDPSEQYDILQNSTIELNFNVTCTQAGGCPDVNLSLLYQRDTLGEIGSVSLSNFEDISITFNETYNIAPIVIATPTSDTNSDDQGLLPVVRDITTTEFTLSLCEDSGSSTCNAVVESETVDYIVIDAQKVENYSWIDTGRVYSITSDGADNTITFNKTFSSVPYVFVWSQTDSDGGSSIAPTAWVDTITTTNAQLIACDHNGGTDACLGNSVETYGYIAIDVANANIGEMSSGTQSISNSAWTTISFSETYSNARMIVSQNSDTGAQDPQYPWARSITGTGGQVRYCEQDASGTCDGHSAETVNWIALENGPVYVGSSESSRVNTTLGATPYYTTDINPQNFSLAEDESIYVNFTINASGTIDDVEYMFGLLDNGIDTEVLTIRTVGFNELTFSNYELNFSVFQTEGLGISQTDLYSRYENVNVNITCISGNCSYFDTSWINETTMTEDLTSGVFFTCSDEIVGNYSSIFEVKSSQSNINDTVALNCSVSLKILDIDLFYPNPFNTTNITVYTPLTNLSFNITCHNATGCEYVSVFAAFEDDNKSWYNKSFEYRQNMTLVSSSTEVFNYTYLIKLNSSLASSQFDWENSCEDIRFADQNNDPMNYWVETCSFISETARIWVKTNSPLVSGSEYNFSMYYGNDNVNTTGSGISTFQFFEDFESYGAESDGVTPSNWTSYSSGTVNLYTESDGNRAIVKTSNDDPNGGFRSLGRNISNFQALFKTNRINEISGTANRYSITNDLVTGYGPYAATFGATTSFIIEERTTGTGATLATGSSWSASQDTWYTLSFTYSATNMNFSVFDTDYGMLNSLTTTDATTNNFSRFYVHGGQEFLTDDIMVREISTTEPTLTRYSEEASHTFIRNETNYVPLWINSSNGITINLTDGESQIITFSVNTTDPVNTTYEILGVLSNGDKTEFTYFYIQEIDEETYLRLNSNKEFINYTLRTLNLTLTNLANNHTPRNSELVIYTFLPFNLSMSNYYYENSSRYYLEYENTSINDPIYNGSIIQWYLVPFNTSLNTTFRPNTGILTDEMFANLRLNISGTNILNEKIIVGMDPFITNDVNELFCSLKEKQSFLNYINGGES